jgi:predicted dithiol-disulfide oxidoreductase (DUF899 family)
MSEPRTGTRDEWLAARRELLVAEKAHFRRGDEIARLRLELPWVPIEKEYSFDTVQGTKTLAELFHGRSQLLVYHFMFGFGPGSARSGKDAPDARSSPITSTASSPT